MSGIRVVDMPDIGAVTDDSSVVGEHAGSGRFMAPAMRDYVWQGFEFTDYTDGGTLTDSTQPFMWFRGSESFAMGTNFYLPFVVDFRRVNGTGFRQALTAQYTSNGAGVNEFLVGCAGFGFIESGSGFIYGMNSYARVQSGGDATAGCISLEANTDLQRAAGQKVGIQIIDVSSSVGDGSAESAALVIAKQGGALGWRTGIQFALDSTAGTAACSAALIRTSTTGGSVARGIDFRTATFTGPAIDLPADTGTTGGISFGNNAGGAIQSTAVSGGPILSFGSGAAAFQTPAGVNVLHVNTSTNTVTTIGKHLHGAPCDPLSDNAIALGESGARWASVWAVNGTIQTSDPAAKREVTPLRDHGFAATDIVAEVQPVTFKWTVGGHDPDGTERPGQRLHWGFMAPELKDAFSRVGLDWGGYVRGEDGSHNLRPDQLIPVLWRCCQEMAQRIEALEAR